MDDLSNLRSVVCHARDVFEQIVQDSLKTKDMRGTCGIAACYLIYVIQKFTEYKCFARGGGGDSDGGYVDHLGQMHGHYWVEVHTPSMDLVVDITADQFGGDQVVFLPLEQSHQYINGQQDLIDDHVIQIRKLFFSSVVGQ